MRKKAEVVRKVDYNKEQETKEQRENKNIILNKDENTENTKSEGEANNRVQNVGKIIEDDKVPVEIANTQTKAKQQDKDIVASKTSNNQQQKETTDNGEKKKWKNQRIVIVNSKAKRTRPITLEVLVQEKKLK